MVKKYFFIGCVVVCVVYVVTQNIIAFFAYKKAMAALDKEYKYIAILEKKASMSAELITNAKNRGLVEVGPKTMIKMHYVEYVKDKGDTIRRSLSINPYTFEQQLKDLSDSKYETYYVNEIPDIIDGKIKPSPKSVVLTFDDGYEDFYTDAFPLLKKYKIKSTIYIVYDFIGTRGFMNKAELTEIKKSDMVEIASHSVDHINLARLPLDRAKYQIFESKRLLEKLFEIQIKTYAYPYGGFNQKVVDYVRQAGYTAAVTVNPGLNYSKDNLYFLPRYRAGMFGDRMTKVLEELVNK